jgi:hypothetical protein
MEAHRAIRLYLASAAARIGRSVKTLKRWAESKPDFPKPRKDETGHWYYIESEFMAYVLKQGEGHG